MDRRKLWCLLLLPLCLCVDSEVTLVKTISQQPDVTPICSIRTPGSLTVVCKVSTERTKGSQCRLLYHHAWGFVNECDSRFQLVTENQTVVLHLTSLTPADSGSYTCECSRPEGTTVLRLNTTVEASHEEQLSSSSGKRTAIVIFCVAAFLVLPGVFLGNFLRTKHCRDDSRLGTWWVSVWKAPCSVTDQDDPDDPYGSLQHPACDLYENISAHYQRNTKTAPTHLHQDTEGQTDQDWEIYENL